MIQTLLFVAGLNTLLQTTFGTRLPAVIGGSYTFVAPTISIILSGRYDDIVDPHEVCNRTLFFFIANDVVQWWSSIFLIMMVCFSGQCAEIQANHARNPGCPDYCFGSSDNSWL